MKKLLLLLAALAAAPALPASPSGPSSPPPSGGDLPRGESRRAPEAPELSFYNDGTKLLFQKDWAGAQKQLEAAVAINEKMPEAHNNLAYVLRKQGEQNYAASLAHYDRAIALKPKMPEAYMYRGALHFFMGHKDLAQADYEKLVKLRSKLAPHLKKIFDTGQEEEPEQFYGVTKKK
jgi:tetratricopeptide (TPR) repeat protein